MSSCAKATPAKAAAKAAANDTPAKVETATPAKAETDTPAKVETATPAKVETATPAKAATVTPAKAATAAPAKAAKVTPENATRMSDVEDDFHVLSKDGSFAVHATHLDFNEWVLEFEQGEILIGNSFLEGKKLQKLINFLKSSALAHYYSDEATDEECEGREGTAFYRMGSSVMIVDRNVAPIVQDCAELAEMLEQLYAQYTQRPKMALVSRDDWLLYASNVEGTVWQIELCNRSDKDCVMITSLSEATIDDMVIHIDRPTTQAQSVQCFTTDCGGKIALWLKGANAVVVDKGLRPVTIGRRTLRSLLKALLKKCENE